MTFVLYNYIYMDFPGGPVVMTLCFRFRGFHWGFNPWVWKIPWRRKWQPNSSIPAWEIPWTEEPGGLQSMGLQKSWTWLSNQKTKTTTIGHQQRKRLEVPAKRRWSTLILWSFSFVGFSLFFQGVLCNLPLLRISSTGVFWVCWPGSLLLWLVVTWQTGVTGQKWADYFSCVCWASHSQ